ncbi:MAG: hypothetical protein B6D59_04260 [Campylobacteraceae bacterium 4484_4]|nr:MAG: hypothetical protein B6D59_04260 [Campylobacteraceae bacterium 4484_4]
MSEKKDILIVEDNLISAQYLKEIVEKEEYRVVKVVDNGPDAIQASHHFHPDAILMDIMLKGPMSGSEAALKIKYDQPDCKIIFITAYADEEMINYAAEVEAFGYLMKPYREKEILATLKIALSHHSKQQKPAHMHSVSLSKGYRFDLDQLKLFKNEREIPLTQKKLRLIELLARHKGSSVSNRQICHYVWGENRSDSTLRSMIHRIRLRIGEDLIINVNGIGYMIS